MHALIVVKPSAVSNRLLGKIILLIEESGAYIEGIKAENLDVHNLKQKAKKEKEPNQLEKISAALNVPCVLIAVAGKNALNVCNKIKDEFENEVHTSSNEEVAKYELARFFKDDELFEYEENDFASVLGSEPALKSWRKYKNKSVEEIAEKENKK